MKSRAAGLPWLLLCAIIGLSVYEFSNTGKVRLIEDGFRKIADAVDDLPDAERTLTSSLNDAKDTLETAFDKAEQATAEALQPLSADLEASPIPTDAKQYRLKRIVDGDTVELGDGTRVRLHGIDTPERDQPYGRQATKALDSFLGRSVYVEEKDTDRYGRLVAVLWSSDGTNVNIVMVCGGHARWYARYAKLDWELRDCQSEAQEAKLGLWADEDAIEPWEWRKK